MKLYSKQQGQGPDLISLHGLFGSQENLGAVNRLLLAHRRVHSLDIRNHGRSPHSDVMDYATMANDIIDYMDAQGLRQVDLLGHSLGGKVAVTVALTRPESVSKLMVLDIAPVTYAARHDAILAGLSQVDLTTLTSRAMADQQLLPYVPEVAVRQFLLKSLYKNEQGQFQWRLNISVIQRHYAELIKAPPVNGMFQGAVLFIKGSASDYIQPEHEQAIRRLFPQAIMATVADADHWLHAQQPDVVARILTTFLTR